MCISSSAAPRPTSSFSIPCERKAPVSALPPIKSPFLRETVASSLGHIVIKFNDDKDDLLEGSIHVEDKPIPKFRIGDEIAILEGRSEALIGKTALVVGDDKTLCAAVALILNDNGARIVEDEDADILVKIK